MAARNIAAGEIFPQTQQPTADYLRTGRSQNVANPPTNQAHFDQWDAGLNLSWELDFWGRFRRGIEAADAALDATVDNYDSVNVILLSQVATSYVNIRTYQERLRLAHENVASTEKTLGIAQLKFDSKVISKLDLLQCKNNVSQSKTLMDRLEIGLRQENYALCILRGKPPVDLTKDPAVGVGPLPTVPLQIDAGIPAQLLERRPDVRQAERLAAAQSARIGIAESNFYPHFAIDGAFGFRSENLNQLFDPRSPEYPSALHSRGISSISAAFATQFAAKRPDLGNSSSPIKIRC
jgi:outer membrane protein TolC